MNNIRRSSELGRAKATAINNNSRKDLVICVNIRSEKTGLEQLYILPRMMIVGIQFESILESFFGETMRSKIMLHEGEALESFYMSGFDCHSALVPDSGVRVVLQVLLNLSSLEIEIENANKFTQQAAVLLAVSKVDSNMHCTYIYYTYNLHNTELLDAQQQSEQLHRWRRRLAWVCPFSSTSPRALPKYLFGPSMLTLRHRRGSKNPCQKTQT
jgi:hypothetical protein